MDWSGVDYRWFGAILFLIGIVLLIGWLYEVRFPTPDCPGCGEPAFWCEQHKEWECDNGKCDYQGEIPA